MKKEKIYRVLEIYEADFGCEERPEGQETMVMVRLAREKQKTQDIENISNLENDGDCGNDSNNSTNRDDGGSREEKTEGAGIREDKIWEEPEKFTMQAADAWLETQKIEEGDLVCLSEGKLFSLGKQS